MQTLLCGVFQFLITVVLLMDQAEIDLYDRLSRLLEGVRNNDISPELDVELPFIPLDAPGMPLPGPNFVAESVRMGDTAPVYDGKKVSERRLAGYSNSLHYLYRRALYDGSFSMNVDFKGQLTLASFIPGHRWACNAQLYNGGPIRSPVMILGKQPGAEEVSLRQHFSGPSSSELRSALYDLDVSETELSEWYVTNLVKFPHLSPGGGTIPAAWLADCAPLLHEELRIVLPDYLLCLGSEASKAVLGKNFSVTNMAGRSIPVVIQVNNNRDEPPRYHTIQVMAAMSPSAVHRTPELDEEFRSQLGSFMHVVRGGQLGLTEAGIDHGNIYSERELAATVDQIIADPDPEACIIAVDAEWHGDYPTEPNAYIRTIQFSYKDKWARCVVLRRPGGEPIFAPSIDRAVFHLNRLLKSTPGRRVRVGGHFLRADLPWLLSLGIDVREEYAPDPVDIKGGGWDTSLMIHAVNETARFGLTDCALRLTEAPRYDVKLEDWKKSYCAKNKIKAKDMEGYGECPADILCPDKRRLGEDNPSYGAYDADVTRRIAMKYLRPGGKLDADQFGNSCWEAYWRHHRVSLAVLEMEQTGFGMDLKRVDELMLVFMQASDCLRNHIREELNWPGFNEQSPQHMCAVLFGNEYTGKRDKVTGAVINVLPPGAITLGLTPVTTTGKRPKLWAHLKDYERHQYSPATGKEVLGIMSNLHPMVRKLRDLKFLSQVLKTTLRRPNTDDAGQMTTDDDGNYEYEDGLVSMLHADQRLRTHLSQILETCRFASRRPNLQNLSSRREDDYNRIMNNTPEDGGYSHLWGGRIYEHPLRSIICVPPGYVGIEADLKGAELAVLAWQAQDPVMMDHIRRNFLPEDHPDFMDLHAYRAVSTYNLPCAPTKKGLKSIGRAGLRVAAKAINFGIPYGQGAEAFVRKCLEEGVHVTAEECQAVIDSYYRDYAQVKLFLDECEERSQDPRWVSGSFKSYRRVPATSERAVIGEQKRQFRNFTIQNGVAESVNDMLHNFLEYRKAFSPDELSYQLLMQIHDSVILLVPYKHVDRVYNEVMDHCMTELAEFRPRRLDGTLIEGAGPYHFGIDKKCFIHWGESITEEEMNRYHLPSCVL